MQTIVKKAFVQLDGPGPAGKPRSAAASARCKQGVRLLRVDSVVHAIEITCSCGESTTIELEYPQTEGAGS